MHSPSTDIQKATLHFLQLDFLHETIASRLRAS
jgi:hypothetical protein